MTRMRAGLILLLLPIVQAAPNEIVYQWPPRVPPPGPPAWVNKPLYMWTPADHAAHARHLGQCTRYLWTSAATGAYSFATAGLSPRSYTLRCGAFAPAPLFALRREAPPDGELFPAKSPVSEVSEDARQDRVRVPPGPGSADANVRPRWPSVLTTLVVPAFSSAWSRFDGNRVAVSAREHDLLGVLVGKPIQDNFYRPIAHHYPQYVVAADQPGPVGRLQEILFGKKK